MASGDTGNVVPGNRLRVRLPCPPLYVRDAIVAIADWHETSAVPAVGGRRRVGMMPIACFREGPAVTMAA